MLVIPLPFPQASCSTENNNKSAVWVRRAPTHNNWLSERSLLSKGVMKPYEYEGGTRKEGNYFITLLNYSAPVWSVILDTSSLDFEFCIQVYRSELWKRTVFSNKIFFVIVAMIPLFGQHPTPPFSYASIQRIKREVLSTCLWASKNWCDLAFYLFISNLITLCWSVEPWFTGHQWGNENSTKVWNDFFFSSRCIFHCSNYEISNH